MARRGQGINIKVPRKKVIKALEQALVKLETNYKNQGSLKAKYDTAIEKWEQQVKKLAVAKFDKAENIRINIRYNGAVNIDFDVPANAIKAPEKPEVNFESMHDWQYKESKEEIESAIRVLNMCDDELISTSTYGSITKYL